MHPHHPMKPFAIPGDWSTSQAMAVVDFLDELRCHIWQRYELPLLAAYRELYAGDLETCSDGNPAEPLIDDPIDF